MSESVNTEKQQHYKTQMSRLNKAIREGFLLEALFIEYAIIEDRCESILRHAGVFDPKKHNMLNRKLSKIEGLITDQSCELKRYITPELLESIYEWKDERNRFIHALMDQQFTHEELLGITERGREIVKQISSKSTSYKRLLERKKR